MRWSQAFIPTLRDDPADAEAASHKLLVRGGFIRQLMAGVYSQLPLGLRVHAKIEGIIREELAKIGGQEFSLPSLLPSDILEKSGRIGVDVLFSLKDRHGATACLGFTHEEIFAWLARELRSYKQLPQIWFQFQTKFRDEERPKSGLLRVREFVMKDSYSFDATSEGLDYAFQQHFEAYRKIFERCGLDTLAVEASSGSMGGSESIEFMVETTAGEDWVVSCAACGYAANVEKATSLLGPISDEAGPEAPEKFATPGVHTIEEIAAFEGGAPADCQIKTLVYVVDDQLTLALLRGDHALVEQKLLDGTGATAARPAGADEIQGALGASAGSLGAVGVSDLRVVADPALTGRKNLVTGANEDGFHLRGVSMERDIRVDEWMDLREVTEGEACPLCEAELAVRKTAEVGHIFKLGTKYSEALGAQVLDKNGKQVPIIMGSYGIGVGRAMAAIVERWNDDNGIIWPVNVAPFEVVVTVVNPKDVESSEAGQRIYEQLLGDGIDVVLDDRDERPGVKFKDAELVGIPYRITVGPKGLANGKVEFFRRRGAEKRDVDVHKAADVVQNAVLEERR
ncbi:MAG: proline--tRNA ligase [Deltaproteobacteria bacterium]|nr:proline--tRNA ligase [Deltaproteobacteria bacterium]